MDKTANMRSVRGENSDSNTPLISSLVGTVGKEKRVATIQGKLSFLGKQNNDARINSKKSASPYVNGFELNEREENLVENKGPKNAMCDLKKVPYGVTAP